MNRIISTLIFLFSALLFSHCSENENYPKAEVSSEEIQIQIDSNLIKLKNSYPDYIIGYTENEIIWNDSTTQIFDDETPKSFDELLNNPSLKDMFTYEYKSFVLDTPEVNHDPGRIRNEQFFRKIYGENANEVRKNLVTINWLPSSENIPILVTSINGVSDSLQKVSDELDKLPHLHKYLKNIGGTFNWRKISKTNRLSSHSFGIAIDINVSYANYWLWDKNQGNFSYRNKIPLEIVNIFEKYGFIWGGKWYHYDTMHFEFRPELL